jgi:16S rRNA (guanine966-N2)-methyltransferase
MNKKSHATNRVRISAGEWRSRVLSFPDVDGLRPTGDRVRQTLFNWLGQHLHGKVCLDAFAGSGALGFEAASRGAARVRMCETDRVAFAALTANKALLNAAQCEIINQDVMRAFAMASSANEKFDIVFCDPPFAAGFHATFLAAVAPFLAEEALVYVESPEPLDSLVASPSLSGYTIVKSAKAGAVFFGLLRHTASG